jgi:parallel beta-helix repeat protein
VIINQCSVTNNLNGVVFQAVSNGTISASTCSMNTKNGINIQGSNYIQILDNIVDSNGFKSETGGQGILISMYLPMQTGDSNIILQGNTVTLTNGTGIRVTESNTVQVYSNNVNGPATVGSNPNPSYCVKIETSSNVIVEKNKLAGGCAGIFAKGIDGLQSDVSISGGLRLFGSSLLNALLVTFLIVLV